MPLAGGIVLPVDQAASENKGFLQHIGKRRENPNMDRNFHLRAGCYYQKASQFESQSVLDSTDSEFISFGENAYFTSACGQ
jgi:hypothetical protein